MSTTTFMRAAAATGALALVLSGCSTGDDPSADGPVTLTMWTRSVTAVQSEALVTKFNTEHDGKIKVELTVIPHTEYLQKVSAAASGKNLPDLLAANVIDGPGYSSLGLWADITDRIDTLGLAPQLAPAHLEVATVDDRTFAVPHVVDTSALYYNKVLFEKAGLDPEKPPTTLDEVHEAALTISSSSADADGLYLPGDCGGCLAFTVFPSIWAAGGTVMNPEGTSANLADPAARSTFGIYGEMWKDGSMAKESRNETGATQNAAFEAGTVGMALLGSKALGTLKENDGLRIGVAPIPGPDGGVSSFVGGDILGISSSSEHTDEAWEFLAWTLDEDVQLELYAQAGFIPVRTDLADNEFAAADPRLLLLNQLVEKGSLPYSTRFFQTFNDPQGPFLSLVREAVFGDGVSTLDANNAAVTTSLQAGR